MTITIGLVANVYQEVNALPGWLEAHLPFFDDVRVMHAGPGGAHSTDGTLEVLKKWSIPVTFCSIDDGFGAVRTKTIHMSPCDYVVLLDADERLFPVHRVMTCSGESTPHGEVDDILGRCYGLRDVKANPPDWTTISRLGMNLRVDIGSPYDQGARLREMLENDKPDAVCTVRRHWHDLSFRRPTQNWQMDPDWQVRIVRNSPNIYFDAGTRMHEQLRGLLPGRLSRADLVRGPFFDHFHFFFKRMEVEQRAHDIAIFDAIHEGRQPPTWKEFWGHI